MFFLKYTDFYDFELLWQIFFWPLFYPMEQRTRYGNRESLNKFILPGY